jgi:probable RNA-binding protein EIF1AD
MPRPKRQFLATAEATLTPPNAIEPNHAIARVVKAEGNNLYSVTLPQGKALLVELPAQFRSKIWIKRGGFVVVNSEAFEERENKLDGEVVNVVGDQKAWMKMPYW